jgi:hypothetical protein
VTSTVERCEKTHPLTANTSQGCCCNKFNKSTNATVTPDSIGCQCTNASPTSCAYSRTVALAAQHRLTWLVTLSRCPASNRGFVLPRQPSYWSRERGRLRVTHSFTAVAARARHAPPSGVTSAPTLTAFRRSLETHLFRRVLALS